MTEEFKLSVYPNPSDEYANIQFTLPANAQNHVSVKIYDMSGKLLGINAYRATGGAQEVQINTSKLAPGEYIYQVKYDKQYASGKLLVK